MKEKILLKLKEIEEKENVKIIYAVESGSRAWGFASPDSDYDVRFIYVRKPDFYLRLDKTRDVIEWQLDDVLDINGWDLDKTLKLIQTSNPVLFEWNNSPIIYKNSSEWEIVSNSIMRYFNVKKCLYHYLSIAKRNYLTYIKGDYIKLKKYFYILRPIFACLWIINKNCPPPMLFEDMVKEFATKEIKDEIDNLVKIKKNSLETQLGEQNGILNDFINMSIKNIEEYANSLKNDKICPWEDLNKIFLTILNKI